MPETEKKFYTAKYDRVFKTIFCDMNHLDLLKEFLHRILEIKIEKIELLQPELNVRNTKEKVKTVDVLVKTKKKFIPIEMNTSFDKYLHYRNFNYFTTNYNLHTKRGEKEDVLSEFLHLDFTFGLPTNYKEKTEYGVISYDRQIPYIKNFKIIEYNMDRIMSFWYSKDPKH